LGWRLLYFVFPATELGANSWVKSG
jgi:hypothetical protein